MSSGTSSLLSLSPKCRIQSVSELEFLIEETFVWDTGSGNIPLMAGLSGILSKNTSKVFLNFFQCTSEISDVGRQHVENSTSMNC